MDEDQPIVSRRLRRQRPEGLTEAIAKARQNARQRAVMPSVEVQMQHVVAAAKRAQRARNVACKASQN